MQCSNARLLTSGGSGSQRIELQQFRIIVQATSNQLKSLLPCSELNKCEQSTLYNTQVSSGNLAASR